MNNKTINVKWCALITLIVLGLTWIICPIGFETNDDTAIMALVSGAYTGTPTSDTMFCGILWGIILSSLYSITDSVPWYALIYMSLTIVTMTIVCYTCLNLYSNSNTEVTDSKWRRLLSFSLGLISFIVLFFILFCYS